MGRKKSKSVVVVAKAATAQKRSSSARSATSQASRSTGKRPTMPYAHVPAFDRSPQSTVARLYKPDGRSSTNSLLRSAGALGDLWADVRDAGSYLAKAFGFGKYEVQRNTLVEGSAHPTFSGSGELRVTHREYVGPVLAATTFTQTVYPLNPGQASCFPVLSKMAACFEEYVPHGIIFEIVTNSATGTSAASPGLGYYGVATQYNSVKGAFSTEQEFLNYDYVVTGPIYSNLIHAIECDLKERPTRSLFVRPGQLPSGANIQFYDLANVVVAVNGTASGGSVVGQLFVTFDFGFKKMKLPQVISPYYHVISGQNASTGSPFGTTWTVNSDVVGATPSGSSVSSAFMVFPLPGQWLVHMIWSNSGAAITTGPTFGLGANVNVAPTNSFTNGNASQGFVNSVGNSTYDFLLLVTAPGTGVSNRVTVTGGLAGMTGANFEV